MAFAASPLSYQQLASKRDGPRDVIYSSSDRRGILKGKYLSAELEALPLECPYQRRRGGACAPGLFVSANRRRILARRRVVIAR